MAIVRSEHKPARHKSLDAPCGYVYFSCNTYWAPLFGQLILLQGWTISFFFIILISPHEECWYLPLFPPYKGFLDVPLGFTHPRGLRMLGRLLAFRSSLRMPSSC